MWNQTRDTRVKSPNECIVNSDMKRFRATARRREALPGWQLCYAVWNFAPAAQLVGVEQQDADGCWRILQSCHTIEFQTRAAAPRSDIVHEHAAPVKWDGDRSAPPRLRLFCRGVGEVKIGAIEIVSSNIRFIPRGQRNRWCRLGREAPRGGWPDFAADAETGEIELEFDYRPLHKKKAGS